MPEPVLEAIDSFTSDLELRDRIARNRLLAAYRRQTTPILEEWRRLSDLVESAPRIATITGSGVVTEAIPPSWIFQQSRYATLQSEVRGLVYGMGAELGDVTLEGQAAAWTTGLDEARAAGTALGEISPRSWAPVPQRAFAAFTGGAEGGPLAPLLGTFSTIEGANARAFARDVIGAGILQGKAARVTARTLEDGLQAITFGRAYRIARTETLRAYREGARASYTANPSIVQSWAWRAAVENRERPPCAACFARHGQLFPISEPMQTHPNCRCRMVPRRSPIFGVTPNDPKLRDATEAFGLLSPAQQRRILGPSRLSMLQAGRVKLSDFATVRDRGGPWGPNIATVRPLYELRNLSGQGRVSGAMAQRLFAQSAAAEVRVSSTLQTIGAQTGGSLQGFQFRLKLPGRLEEKIVGDVIEGRGGIVHAGEGINDALRYTMTFSPADYAAGVARTRAALAEQGISVVKTKNYWSAPDGYREYRIIGRDPDGARFELQFHTPDSFAVKMEKSHPLYVEQRALDTTPARAAELQRQIDDLWRSVEVPAGAADLG